MVWKGKRTTNSTRGHSTDQAKGTDADVGDEERSEDSAVVEYERREKGTDGIGFDGGPTRLRENRG